MLYEVITLMYCTWSAIRLSRGLFGGYSTGDFANFLQRAVDFFAGIVGCEADADITALVVQPERFGQLHPGGGLRAPGRQLRQVHERNNFV